MPNSQWADYPFPLISTPAVEGGYQNKFIRSASKMALVHNVIIRGMNAIYLQCQHLPNGSAVHDFIVFCQCWSEFLHNHHTNEEAAYFPIIEKEAGIEGIADTNVDQHEAFMDGLRAFDKYAYSVEPQNFSGPHVIEILDSFAAKLQMHLTEEVVWILSLSRFPNLDLARIDAQHARYVRGRQSMTRVQPFLLTNHDITYENSIHAWFPQNGRIRDFFLRYMCSLVHRGAWNYSSCSLAGQPKTLFATEGARRWQEKKGEPDLEMGPRKPPKAYARVSDREREMEAESAPGSPTGGRGSMNPLVR